jgi:protein involved in sex pheromone biosynthesis
MKKMLVVLLVGLVFVLNGCIAVAGNTHGEVKGGGGEGKGYHTSAMADVDFVSNLSDQAKVDGYKAIAQKRLTQAERAYLVEAVKKDSLDQKQKDEILLVLLNNPNLRPGPDVKTDKPRCNK